MTKNMKTQFLKTETVKRQWITLDATGKTLGRLASEIAKILRGKHRPDFTPHIDCGDGVIVVNAEKIEVTGNKSAQKLYRYHTGHMGGMQEISYKEMKKRKPEYIIEHAVRGMMPSTRLAGQQFDRLRVFAGPQHTLEAQKPIEAKI